MDSDQWLVSDWMWWAQEDGVVTVKVLLKSYSPSTHFSVHPSWLLPLPQKQLLLKLLLSTRLSQIRWRILVLVWLEFSSAFQCAPCCLSQTLASLLLWLQLYTYLSRCLVSVFLSGSSSSPQTTGPLSFSPGFPLLTFSILFLQDLIHIQGFNFPHHVHDSQICIPSLTFHLCIRLVCIIVPEQLHLEDTSHSTYLKPNSRSLVPNVVLNLCFQSQWRGNILYPFTQVRNPGVICDILFLLLFNPSLRPGEFMETPFEYFHLSIFTTTAKSKFLLHYNNLLNDFPTYTLSLLQYIFKPVMIIIFLKHTFVLCHHTV